MLNTNRLIKHFTIISKGLILIFPKNGGDCEEAGE